MSPLCELCTERYEERAAILEYEALLPRPLAEVRSRLLLGPCQECDPTRGRDDLDS